MSHVFPPPLDGEYRVVDGRILTRSLEAHVVDHCNLTCDECCSLSPLLPKWIESPAQLARDLEWAAAALSPRVFKLVGGEPLLHPEIVELARLGRQIAPRVSVTTNGLLLMRMPDRFWDAVDALTISVYPRPKLPEAAIAERAARAGVEINWKRQDQFVQMTRATRSEDDAETRTIYSKCWIRERCHLVRDGMFYTCTRPPHFATLQERDLSADGVRLHEGPSLRDEILTYLQREQPLEACAFCLGGNAALKPHRLLGRRR